MSSEQSSFGSTGRRLDETVLDDGPTQCLADALAAMDAPATESERPLLRAMEPTSLPTVGGAEGTKHNEYASAAMMGESLEALVRLIERVSPGMRASVLLLDDDGITLRHGAAPNLPVDYCRAIDGAHIGPVAGSCGTAAYRREQVIVRDIATDPLWADYRALAEPYGLAACWSTPILDGGRVLGTFAMYYGQPREPSPEELALTETASLLARNIILRARAVATLQAREEQLRSSQARLRAALDASSTSTFRWDIRTNDVECDEGLARLFGLDPGAASGSFEHFVMQIHPDERDRVIAAALRCAAHGGDLDEEFRVVRQDGTVRWLVDKGKTVLGEDGRPRWLIGACVDVTELREAELERDRALAEASAERHRLYEVFMQAPAAIAVLEGPEHVFTVSNPRYRELLGNREVVGMPVRAALQELEGQGYFELLDGVFTSGQPFSARERVVRLDRDGDGEPEDFYVDFVYQPLKEAGGSTFGILVHAVEVTEQVRARTEIAAARAEAERANRAKSQFLAAMSHDLRTPLNAIGGYASLVGEGLYGPVVDAQRTAMSRIQRAQQHLLTLIGDILSFAKIEAGRIQLELADLPVDKTLAGVETLIGPQVAAKGLVYEYTPGPPDVRVRADRERTVQILVNLITNAVKFTDAGSIAVDWQADDRAVRVNVRDTGRGIPPDRLAAIFEPFVQAGRSAEEQRQGVGLGLAISRELARAMGGELTVQSTVGQGSNFTLSLPRSSE